MRFSITTVLALAVPLLQVASAIPVKRDNNDNTDNILVFQFADVLNHLENQFYTQALSQFQDADFTNAGFSNSQVAIQLLSGIATDESTHFQVLEAGLTALGGSPITACSFDFSAVLTDVNTMLDTARVVENVGVAAFLGAAPLLNNNVLLDSAGTILTVEARHQTILNVLNIGSAIPQSFDIALTPSEVLAIAGDFISGCDLGVPANPSLAITTPGVLTPGTQLSFSSSAINGSTSSLFCQMIVGGEPAAVALPLDQCVVPQGVNGPVVIFITSDGQPLINNVIDRTTDTTLAGPAMVFIDTASDLLGQLARSESSGSSSVSSPVSSPSASTIPAAAASSIIQSISAATATATTSATSIIPSISVGTSTATTSVALATSSAATTAVFPPGGSSNTTTGPVDGGAVTVNGWTTVGSVPSPSR